ncbi:SCO2583/SCO2584 N-terminal domain-containing protein [Streptomyces sp. 4N124]|uniref:SCO2583/SCO2584 N-terminal domain-containing protein n=1 Tax=Streptomyces sp. 4N124 TaxID=3457420 RepID=UPI003FD3D5FD
MSERHDGEREFDLRWADSAEHKEPSARARMLAARWKENPPGPVPFRADPGPVRRRRRSSRVRSARRSSWISTAIVLGSVAAIILLLGYLNFRPTY